MPPLFQALLALSALSAPDAAAQRPATNYFECACPGRSSLLRVYDSENKSCEEACGGSGGGGPSGPDWAAIQRQKDEQLAREALEREAAEAAARRAREALEREKFQATKKEAISSLKGDSTEEPALKGESAEIGGLKGLDTSENPGLKEPETQGGRAADEQDSPSDSSKKCHAEDVCVEALDKPARALESARTDQADLYLAVGTADLLHGLSNVKDLNMPPPPPDAPSYFVWKNSDQAGYPLYVRDYKTTVDGISNLITAQRAAALNGAYDSKSKSLLDAKVAVQKLKKLRKQANKISAFQNYIRDLAKCADGRDSDWNKCVGRIRDLYKTALGDLPLDKATKARVKAAADAYTRYTGRALDRAKDSADAASKCYKNCR